MQTRLFRFLALVVPLAACGCQALAEQLSGLYRVQQAATIGAPRDTTAIIAAPDTVDRGAAFDMRFTSYESKCTNKVRDEYSVRHDSVLIESVVSVSSQCGDALQFMSHVVPAKVEAPGRYRIFLRGRATVNGYSMDTVFSRPLIVR